MVIQIQRIVILVTCILLSDDKKIALQTNTGKLMIS